MGAERVPVSFLGDSALWLPALLSQDERENQIRDNRQTGRIRVLLGITGGILAIQLIPGTGGRAGKRADHSRSGRRG